MKITEYDVQLKQLVERDLTQEEIDFLNSPLSKGLAVKWNIEDSKEDQIADIVSQYLSKGFSKEEAEQRASELINK